MKKIIFMVIALVGLLFIPLSVNAATASVRATASSSKINLGSSVTVTVTVTGSVPIGSWQYNLVYDTAKLTLTSSTYSTYIVDYASSGSTYKKTYTYTFKSKALGNASISIKNAAVVDFKTVSDMDVTAIGCTINIANFSSNANLSSLSLSSGELNPAFNANTTTYNVSVPNTVNSITISATADDSKADVGGVGTFAVIEGSNTFTVSVTAENGTTKSYVLNVEVSELNPISVKIEDKDYIIVRNAGKVPTPVGYKETKININDNEIAAYESDVTDLTLVVLKDTESNLILAVYHADKNEYSLYKQLTSSDIILYLMEPDDRINIPLGYKTTKVKINDIEYNVWNLPDNMNKGMYLIYGMNIETGEKGFYQYDNVDQTIQRFDNDQVVKLQGDYNKIKMVLFIVLGIFSLIALTVIIVLIIKLIKNSKTGKLLKKHKK